MNQIENNHDDAGAKMDPHEHTPPHSGGKPQAAADRRRSMRSSLTKATIPFVAVAALTVLVDQLSKMWIERNVEVGEVALNLWLVRIINLRNDGIAWGFLSGYGDALSWIIPIVVAILVGYFIYYTVNYKPNIFIPLAFGLMVGGALGNLVDRLRQGFVTDFINPRFFATFNLADSAISVGLLIVVLVLLFPSRQDKKQDEANDPPPQTP